MANVPDLTTLLRFPRAPQPSVSSQSVRYLNEMRALDVLFREGGMSRADLARSLGLNRSTTGSIIANLLAESLVVEQTDLKRGSSTYRTGRPGIEVELNPAGAHFVGAAIEAERLTALVIDLAGGIVRSRTTPFDAAGQSPERAVDALAELIDATIGADPDGARVRGVCVTVPGMFRDGVLMQATLLGWHDVDLGLLLAERLSVSRPIAVENDANAFAIAETYKGAAPPATTVAFLLVDSGAGGGIVNGGRLMRGGSGLAGEFGHLVVGGEGYAPGRGEPGTLESYIGREALLARYRANGGADVPLSGFIAALERQEIVALRTADDWSRWLVEGLLPIVNVVNPSLIIVGGPVGSILRFVGDRVEARLASKLPRSYPLPRIEVSRFGVEGAAYGGALLLHQRAFSIDERALYPDSSARNLFAM